MDEAVHARFPPGRREGGPDVIRAWATPALAVGVALLVSCSTTGAAVHSTEVAVGAPACATGTAAARQYLEGIAAIGGRYSFTAKEADARRYVTSALEQCGYPVTTQPFTVRTKQSANVIAVKRGTSASEIIIGAHYDSVDASHGGADGVDDNGSGVAVLLDLAARMHATTTPYTIKFIAFGAEEANEMYGSRSFVTQYVSPELDSCGTSCVDRQNANAPILAMINLDALAVGDIAYVHGDNNPRAGSLLDWVTRTGAKGLGLDNNGNGSIDATEQVDTTVPENRLFEDSDYYYFTKVGITFLYFEATNWRIGRQDGFTQVDPQYGDGGAIYHTRYDNLRYLDDTFPGRIDARLALFGDLLERIVTQYHQS